MRLFLAGEGVDELGEWLHHPGLRDHTRGHGILEALLTRITSSGWSVGGATAWSGIRKFKAGEHRSNEARNVLGATLQAIDAGCDALVFVRDRDSDEDRQADVEDGIRQSLTTFPNVKLCGGMAVEEIEAWILALHGQRRSESHKHPKEHIATSHGIRTRYQKVSIIEAADMDQIPNDAPSLNEWLKRAMDLLHPGQGSVLSDEQRRA